MLVPMSWLRTWVDTTLSTEDIAERLTVAGIEVETTTNDVLELAILANIARCQSIRGVAKEVSALTGANYQDQASGIDLQPVPCKLTPRILDSNVCQRFSLGLIEHVGVTDSPKWLQDRLRLAGVEPINNIVDAGNYVMLEMGQPLHTYDADKLSDHALGVRLSRQGDALHTLAQTDEQAAMTIPENVPVIVCGDTVVSVAGIIGGSESAVSETTSRILLEAANFDYIMIRRAQSATKTFTEASARFSRGVDPALTLPAIARFVQVLKETCPEASLVMMGDENQYDDNAREITISLEKINRSLGLALSAQDVIDLLARVNLSCEHDNGEFTVYVDSSRDDMALPCDVVEEIIRLYGFDRLPETMPRQSIPPHPRARIIEQRESARDAMVNWGLQEVVSYSIESETDNAKLFAACEKVPAYEQVKLLNSATEDRTVLRRSLLPGLLHHAQLNLRYQPACHLFEIGPVFLPETPGYSSLLPTENLRATALLHGTFQRESLHDDNKPRQMDFYDAVALVNHLCAHLHVGAAVIKAAEHAPLQPGMCASIHVADKLIGYVGKVHELVANAFALEGKTLFAIDIDLDVLLSLAKTDFHIVAPPRYPSIELDISVVVDESVSAGDLMATTRRSAGDLLQDITVFDVYRGDKLGDKQQAIALRFSLNAQTKTLTMDEANQMRETIIADLAKAFGARLRD